MTYGYSSESTQQEIPNEYQHDGFPVLWKKLASASEGFKLNRRVLAKSCLGIPLTSDMC